MSAKATRKAQWKIINFPWLIWGLTAAFVTFQFIIQSSSGVMASGWTISFDINPTEIGQLSASFFIPYVLMQIPVGLIIDKYKPRRVLTIAAGVCGLGCLLFALAPYYWLAIFARMLMGLGASFAFVGMLYSAAAWFPARRFSFIIGLCEMVGMVGTGIGLFLISVATTSFSWRIAMGIAAIIALVIMCLSAYFLRDRSDKPVLTTSKLPAKPKLWQSLKLVVPNSQLWFNGLANGFLFTSVSVFAALWSVPFLIDVHKLSQNLAALTNAMIFVGIAFGSIFWSWLASKIYRRKPICLLGIIVVCAITCLIIYVPTLPDFSLYFLLFLIGFFASSYMQCFAIAHEIAPRQLRGTAMGLTNMLSVLGSPVIQPIVGYVIYLSWNGAMSKTGGEIYTTSDYQIALTILPICFILAFICMALVKETHCKPVELR